MICLSSARSISFNAAPKDVPVIRGGHKYKLDKSGQKKKGKREKVFASSRVQNFVRETRSGILLREFNFSRVLGQPSYGHGR